MDSTRKLLQAVGCHERQISFPRSILALSCLGCYACGRSPLTLDVRWEELLQAAQADPELLKLLRDQTTQELDTDIKKESDAAAERVVQI